MRIFHQKLFILFLFFSHSIFSSAQETGTSGISSTSHEPLRIYENLGGDFELTGPDGNDIYTENFRGKVVLIYFGYTNCPDV